MKHIVIVRSNYEDPRTSLCRALLAENTLIPCLRSQTFRNFEVFLIINDRDPYRETRMDTWSSFNVRTFRSVEEAKQHLPTTPYIVTRIDDDDFVDDDFIGTLQRHFPKNPIKTSALLTYPYGFLLNEGKLYHMSDVGNMFISLKVVDGSQASPFDMKHGHYKSYPHIEVVSFRNAWVWHRHGDNKSPLATRRLQEKLGDSGSFCSAVLPSFLE